MKQNNAVRCLQARAQTNLGENLHWLLLRLVDKVAREYTTDLDGTATLLHFRSAAVVS